MKNTTNNLIGDIKDNLKIILLIVGLIVGWTTITNRLTNVEAQVQENKTILQAVYQIQIDMAVMKTDINYIKRTLK